ncbi:MAG: DUF4174 domain-containing protein [Yoonia sp.]|uniref:DUF4174 domain-containing protein n=1 Tax=Yoonia sp. TaxID=2212373 RepID=UPI003EF527ED
MNIAVAVSLALPAAAQEQTALVETRPVTTDAQATEAESLTVFERWEADPTTVFDGAEVTLADLQWVLRPLVLFADTPNDPRFRQQFDLLIADIDQLAERDVIVITDTNPDEMSDLRTRLRPRGYMLALLGKDGRVALRKPSPWSVRELSRSIDKMPLRQQEISDRRMVQP